MLASTRFRLPRPPFDIDPFQSFRPSRLLPLLRAFGGVRAPEAGKVQMTERLGRLGSLEIRLARTAAEVRRAQKLRFDVFYRELLALPHASTKFSRRDVDAFDALCDHLLVFDHAITTAFQEPKLVATCRLLRQDLAERRGGFYSAGEFDVGSLLERHPTMKFLELGRSCVLPSHRNKRTIELLWHGIWTYVLQHCVDVMIGCASFEGTDLDRLTVPLSFVHHFARAPEMWRTRALTHRYVELDRMPKAAIDKKAALHALPPLIKGYLRLGAGVGDGAVVDREFGTTDVFIVLPVSAISSRYVDHFGASADRHAA
jgi:putative hemolysin